MRPQIAERPLFDFLARYESVVVAFSGGVDSSYLAFAAHQVLGSRSHSVTALSPAVAASQRAAAERFAIRHGLRHSWIRTHEMELEEYRSNPVNRCFHCKTELYGHLRRFAQERGIDAIFDGANLDDLDDFRPGRRAAEEKGIVSPLLQAGLRKEEIRAFSKRWGLETWDMPASPCLSSRFPYGVALSTERLSRVDQAEAFLRELGFRHFRVRHHENLARIEVDRREMPAMFDLDRLDRVQEKLKSLGFQHVTLDLRGFRSGSLNETIRARHGGKKLSDRSE